MWILACHSSHIPHHKWHVNLYDLQIIYDQSSNALWYFFKTKPKQVSDIFLDQNHRIYKTNAKVK